MNEPGADRVQIDTGGIRTEVNMMITERAELDRRISNLCEAQAKLTAAQIDAGACRTPADFKRAREAEKALETTRLQLERFVVESVDDK